MTGLSTAHRVALAQMLERVPQSMLAALSPAVASMPGLRAAQLAEMIDQESVARERREWVLGPILPLFQPRADGLKALSFPPAALPCLWRAASAREPGLLSALDAGGPRGMIVADRICLAAAAAVRDQPELVWPKRLGSAKAREAGLVELAGCCDLASLARRGLPSLSVWMGRPDGDQSAAFRLLLRDAARVAPDGVRRMLDIFFAHMADGAPILRLVMLASGGAGRDSFVAETELAVFTDRLLDAVEAHVAWIAAFDPKSAKPDVAELKSRVDWCTAVLIEIDVTLDPSPTGVWGKRAYDARQRLNRKLSGMIRKAAKAVDAALPMIEVPLTGRMKRRSPRLDAPVQSHERDVAAVVLGVVRVARGPAAAFGFEAERQQAVEALTERLSAYADEVIETVNAGEAENDGHALGLVDMAGRFLILIEATAVAQTVRRRATVAGAPTRRPELSPGAV